MAFDAGMLSSVIREINGLALGGRIDKINQPSKDEIILNIRSVSGNFKLLINAGPNNPRLGFTSSTADNPDKPPMFCVLLRRHISGARLVSVTQLGFERAAIFEFAARDELGFDCTRKLVAEVMGKYSNLILTDGDGKIISALKIVDFTTSSKRQVLPGMRYEAPPKQDKHDPTSTTKEEFISLFNNAPKERAADKFISSEYLGISSTVAREIVCRATRHTDTPLAFCDANTLYREFSSVFEIIKSGKYEPTLIYVDGKPTEYCFMPLIQYGNSEARRFDTLGELLDSYYLERDREQRTRQRAADLLKLLTNAEARIKKKLELQRAELSDCEKGITFKERGDLITANIYKLSRGDKKVTVTDYSKINGDGSYVELEIELDERLSPSANAQRYYKKYAKTKTAKVELSKQIAIGESELEYVYSVFDALSHAETAADLAEIREELAGAGYASKLKLSKKAQRHQKPQIAKFVTSGGYTVLCGKNNIQNEYITFKLAEKDDWWFHAKGTQGSHVLMQCNGEEPSVTDFTEAAEIAAAFSRAAGGEKVDVDYTKARNVKKPSSGKPGLVIYHTNWSCTVTPNADAVSKRRIS